MYKHFLLYLISLISSASFAQGTVAGYVFQKQTTKPITAAHIRVGNNTVVSDENGYFVLNNLSSGYHKVTISSIGYVTYYQEIDIEDNAIKHIEVLLEEDIETLNEIIVSATRTENRISDIPGRIELISQERIQFMNHQSIDEVLALSPGIQTARSFGLFSHKSTVSMRGVSGKEQARTLVLIDRVPVNKSDGGSVNWNLLSTQEIEKIEVVKGPGSALYGGNAMGGIIHIITKKPVKKFEGKFSLSYGTYNTRGVKGSVGGNTDRGFYWNASGILRTSDGYINQSFADRLSNPHIVKSTFDERAMHIKTGYQKGERFKSELQLSIFDDRRETGEKVFQPHGNTTDHDTYSLRLALSGKTYLLNWNTSLFIMTEHYKRVSEWLKDDYTWYDVLSVRNDYGMLSGVNFKWKNHTFSTGLDVKVGAVDASDIYYTSTDQVDNHGKMISTGIYLQDYIRLFSDKVSLVAGLRVDYSRFYEGGFLIYQPSAETDFMKQYQFSDIENQKWNAISPRLSVQYKGDHDFRAYLTYGKGFRPSVLDDLCRSGRVRGGFKVANPGLRPEYLNNLEAGMDYKPFKWIKFDLSAYYSIGSDFLYYVSTGDSIDMGFGNRPIMIRSNISNVDIYGVECELTVSAFPSFSFFGSYAWNVSKITSYNPSSTLTNADLTGKYLSDVPQHSFALGALFRSDLLNASLTGRFTGKMFINDQNIYDYLVLDNQYPAVFIVDCKLQRQLFKYVFINFGIQNIFDTKIYESNGAVGPGRFVMLELGIKF